MPETRRNTPRPRLRLPHGAARDTIPALLGDIIPIVIKGADLAIISIIVQTMNPVVGQGRLQVEGRSGLGQAASAAWEFRPMLVQT